MRSSLPLLLGEAGGYLTAILMLRLLVGPVVAREPLLGPILSGGVCLYVLRLSVSSYGKRVAGMEMAAPPVTVGGVFVTTLLNPKAIVFAFTLLPLVPVPELGPRLAALTVLILIAGTAWIFVGAAIRHGTGISSQADYRAGAAWLLVLTTALGSRAAGLI